MANNRLVFEGLAELRAALRNLPEALAAEAAGLVLSAAENAAAEIINAYPERTGNLRKGVRTSVVRGGYGVIARVENRAKHAFIFENGTQARHTNIGANRGAMPPGHVFIPIAMRRRREMYEHLIAMLKREGFEVTGDAGSV